MSFQEMDPRELVRGLMHGNKAELKLGYTAENATLAACKMQKISDLADAANLLAYAAGYSDGMQDRHGNSFERMSGLDEHYRAGFNDGQDTDVERVYPG